MKLENREIEALMLAACMHGEPYLDRLSEDDFTTPEHLTILRAMRELEAAGEPIEMLSVYHHIAKEGKPAAFVFDIESQYFAGLDYEHYYKQLKEYTALRKMKRGLYQVWGWMKEGRDLKDIRANAIDYFSSIALPDEIHQDDSMKNVMLVTLNDIEKQCKQQSIQRSTGLAELDEATGGLFGSEVTIIAARPAVGKTAIAIQIGLEWAKRGQLVQFFTLEMSKQQLGRRFIAHEGEIDAHRIRIGDLDETAWTQITDTTLRLSGLPLYITEKARTVGDIQAICRERKQKQGLDLVIIDYLQLIECTSKKQNREQEVADISRKIKLLSLELDVPILLLSQLNRDAEGRRPNLSHLRESGAIEQDADNILFLHRPRTDELETQAEKDMLREMEQNGNVYVEVIIGKQRQGRTGMFTVMYIPKYLKFVSIYKGGG